MTTTPAAATGWRTVDIVVASVLGVAFGVVFWQWGLVWAPLFLGQVNPLAYLVSGVWLAPAVLAALVIQKPGAALFAEALAATVSALLGSAWGLDTVASGVMQGAGAELVFALTFYRSFGVLTALLAGAGAAVGEWLHDMTIYYPQTALELQLAYGAFMLVSGVLIAGLGSWLLARAMVRTGVLAPFPSGRSQPRV
ncbi:MAG TPA: ECF transporter S component [Candidatus Binatia bacterium]|nr:ECF transporter S component [Candidatus Binatia bacterium]